MQLDLAGRVRNTKLPSSKPLLPLFDAIVNALHAIEESAGRRSTIDIRPERDWSQTVMGEFARAPIHGFLVSDSGIGFTDQNFVSFDTADSTLKAAKGGKGLGRFLWLKAFESTRVESVFQRDGDYYERTFDFDIVNGIHNVRLQRSQKALSGTTVHLLHAKAPYRDHLPRRGDIIARKIIDHCTVYFMSQNCPAITITDGDTKIDLNELFRRDIYSRSASRTFRVKNVDFAVTHLKLYSQDEPRHRLHLCAHSREVVEENLSSLIPDLQSKLQDENSQTFVLSSYVSGDLLDETVNSERSDFVLPDEPADLLPDDVSKKDLRKGVELEVRDFLRPYLDRISEEKLRRIERFVHDRAPQYRPLLRHRPETLRDIPPGLPDDRLDIELHRIQAKVEAELKEIGAQLVSGQPRDADSLLEAKEQFHKFIDELNEFGKSSLAQYIVHRKLVLDLLTVNLESDAHGRYRLEENVHEIIFPLKSTSDDVDYENQNLWIIDEKLSYHKYLASDKTLTTLDPVVVDGRQRPDVIIFNSPFAFVEDTAPYSSIVIIEFKRAARTGYTDEENPLGQVYEYIRKIRKGSTTDRRGRPIPISETTPFYSYIVCDLTPSLKDQAENANLLATPDGMGYFGYNRPVMSYIEIISYDKLIADAKKRNRILFDKLNLPNG